MHVQVRVSEQGAIRNGRFAFSDKLTLVSELLQNARRAGATKVRVDFDEPAGRLTVSDDGCGIDDFQKLLTFNDSGWDEATIEAETAFGVGFSKCLYAAERVTVQSRGMRLEFECAAALAQQPLTVVDDSAASALQTVVRLDGIALPRLAEQIGRLVRGFPLPVVFNGVELSRPHAIESLPFVARDIGHIHLAGSVHGRPSTATAMYLQGLLVCHRDYYCDHDQVDVIHLDPRRFLARLPDRKELIDEAEQRRTIDAGVRVLWRTVLEARKVELTAHEFAERFFRIARVSGNVDLFDDVDVLPRHVCSQVAGYPIFDQDHAWLEQLAMHIDRAAVERGDMLLGEIDCLAADDLPRWMFARSRGYVLVETAALGEHHWMHGYVRNLSHEDCTVAGQGIGHSVEFDGRWICPTVTFCATVEISLGADRVVIDDEAVYADGIAFYPAQATGGDVSRQISRYEDENERFVGDDCEADTNALGDFVRRLRSSDPIETLRSLMRELSLDRYPLLVGKAFRIAVGASAQEHSVELVG